VNPHLVRQHTPLAIAYSFVLHDADFAGDRFDYAQQLAAYGGVLSTSNGGAIDLAMHVLGLSFVDAVKRLTAR
jgi:hypothetical protein